MNALSKLFEVLHLSRGEMTLRRSHRRRRARRRESALSCETLEPKQLLAADLVAPISADPVVVTNAPVAISLEDKFGDNEVSGTVVKFETNAPLADNDFYVELTNNTPLTNANFLSYVKSGAYDNSMFHRSVPNFVIQGGGFSAPTVDADQPGSNPVSIPTTGTVRNEPGNLNKRGTISMAKLDGQPDSATSQFFFNLENNSFLDSDNGGYTAFGEVLGSGMTNVDLMAADALAYDATTYYANTALSDLPLWNVNGDNIVRPNDFVKIQHVDEVPESALFNYTFSGFDTNKLTVSESNGNIVLTPVGNATGTFDVTVTATSKLPYENASEKIVSDTFSVQLNGGGPVGPLLTPIEQIGNTFLNRDSNGRIFAGEQAITYVGGQVKTNSFDGFEPIAAENIAGSGRQVLFKATNSTTCIVWTFADDWSYVSGLRIRANMLDKLQTIETQFGVDLGIVLPEVTAIENIGNTFLNVNEAGQLFAGYTPIQNGGFQISVGQFDGYTAIAAENLGTNEGGMQVVFQRDSGDYAIWSLKQNGSYFGGRSVNAVDSVAITELQNAFGFYTVVENDGSVKLNKKADGTIHADSTQITKDGSSVDTNALEGLTPLGVDDFGNDGGKQLLLVENDGDYVLWDLDSNYSYTSEISVPLTDLSGVSTIQQKFNRQNVIESDGSNVIQYSADGKLFVDEYPVFYDNQQVTRTQFTGFTPVAAETVDSGARKIVWRGDNGEYSTWTCNSSWAYQGGQSIAADAIELKSALETDFEIFVSIETGTTKGLLELNKVSNGKLFAGNIPIMYDNNEVLENQFNGFTPLAVERVSGQGRQVLWSHADGRYVAWSLDSDFNYIGGKTILASDQAGINEVKRQFGFYVEKDAVGRIRMQVLDNGVIYAGINTVKYQGNAITETQFGNYRPLAVENLNTQVAASLGLNIGRNVVFYDSTTGKYIVWTLKYSDWSYNGGTTIDVTQTSRIELLSEAFGLT